MILDIHEDYQSLSTAVADGIAKRIIARQSDAPNRFVLGLPTGETPLGVYAALVQKHLAGELSFQNVVTFNMDEFSGLSDPDSRSCAFYMHEHLFRHIDLPEPQRHLLPGITPEPNHFCNQYEQLIAESGGIDLFLAGLGRNGHLAFNEPGSALESRTRVAPLASETRELYASQFGGLMNTPQTGMTVGLATIMGAAEIVLVASGGHKAEALARALTGPIDSACPASVLQSHPNCTVVCDMQAAIYLETKSISTLQSTP